MSPSLLQPDLRQSLGLHWHYLILLSGFYGIPVSFQHLINVILRLYHVYAAAYLDDVIHFFTWIDFLHYLREMLGKLQKVALTNATCG